MFVYEKAVKEENAIQSLLAFSQNDEKCSLLYPGAYNNSNVENNKKKPSNKNNVDTEHQMSAWQEKYVLNFPHERKEQNTSRSSRDVVSTNKSSVSTLRSSTRLKSKLASALEQKLCFYHLDSSREYITQYRERITYTALLEYRKGWTKSYPTGNCKICKSTFDLTKHSCQCSATIPASSSVNYVETQVCLKKNNLLNAMKTLSLHSDNDRSKYYKDKKCRRISPGNVKKLWPYISAENGKSSDSGKGKKSAQNFKNKSRCNVRLKIGNDSSEALRIYTSQSLNTPYGPRMGSNHPPINDASEISNGTPTSRVLSCLKPKVTQAAIPNRSTSSFQACIRPMSVPRNASSQSKTP